MRVLLILTFGLLSGALLTLAAQHLMKSDPQSQPYAGQHKRIISSLSESDVRQLERGEGWGLAKSAEFNNYPGPLHVLELASKLELSEQQSEAINASFVSMNERARELGRALIDAEIAIDAAFRKGGITEALLIERLQTAEQIRTDLRAVHLIAHLEVTPLLSELQKTRYSLLRGYAGNHHHGTGH